MSIRFRTPSTIRGRTSAVLPEKLQRSNEIIIMLDSCTAGSGLRQSCRNLPPYMHSSSLLGGNAGLVRPHIVTVRVLAEINMTGKALLIIIT